MNIHSEIHIGGVKDADIMLFTRHLHMVLKSGLTLLDGLQILQDQARAKMKTMIMEMVNVISSGDFLHAALQKYPKYFSAMYVNMVRTGEVSGMLEDNLDRLSISLEKNFKLKKKVKSVMIYPAFVLFAIFGLGIFVSLFILPQILPLFSTLDVKLPLSTRVLLFIAAAFRDHGVLLVFSIVFVIVFFAWIMRRNFIKPYSHWIFLKLPIIGIIVRNINLERFMRTCGMLLSTGIPIDKTLSIALEAMENRVYRKAVSLCIPCIASGNSIAETLEKFPKLFPSLATRMIGVGERTGRLDSTFKYLADFYEEEVDDSVKNLATLLEPILLIIIGIVVGTAALAILGPIYTITGSLRN